MIFRLLQKKRKETIKNALKEKKEEKEKEKKEDEELKQRLHDEDKYDNDYRKRHS